MCRIFLFSVALLGSVHQGYAQSETGGALLRGRIVTGPAAAPLPEVRIALPYLRRITYTDAGGEFSFPELPAGTQTLVIGGGAVRSDTLLISIAGEVVVAGDLPATLNDRATSLQSISIPTIALEESDGVEEEGIRAAPVSGLLTAGRDPFLSTAAFVFGPYRFQPRGRSRGAQQVLINGAPMNDVETTDASWSLWGGLNDVFRGRSNTYGLVPGEWAYGGINGTVAFDAVAARQRAQTRVTYSASNRQYRNRAMFTRSSGLTKRGWAYAVSGSRRWAGEGYIPGTFYDSWSGYFAGSKQFSTAHSLHLTAFGSTTQRGKSAPVYQEAADIAGSNYYNPNWGYQNGKVRNARVGETFQPVALLTYEWKPDQSFQLTATAGYQQGISKNSVLDWYNAPDPRPDYYRNLPSTYALDGKNPDEAPFYRTQQIEWDHLIAINRTSFQAPTAGSPLERRSLYVVGSDVEKTKKWTGAINIQKVLGPHMTLAGGAFTIQQWGENYRQLDDLLDGDFYRNLNQFALFNNAGLAGVTQNNLDAESDVVRAGDRYFYNFENRFSRTWVWQQLQATYNKVDFFLAGSFGQSQAARNGLWRSGLYAGEGESLGQSRTPHFSLWSVKGGITYKLDGRNYFFVNGLLQQDAPLPDNVFISARSRNFIVPDVVEQEISSTEAGYVHHSPSLSIRAVGYATNTRKGTDIKHFFLEGGGANTFVNYVLTDLSTRNMGTEIAAEYKLTTAFSLTAVAAIGQSFYVDNPQVAIYLDNFVDPTGRGGFSGTEQVHLKNHYLAAGPQSAYSLGVGYRSPKYWYGNLNASFLDRNYIDIAPTRRTEAAVAGLEPGGAAYNSVISQERFKGAFTLDLFGGKSFLLSKTYKKLPRNTFLYLNGGISNLLDNRTIRTGGFENLRLDDGGQINRFPSKYFYAFGRSFFLNLSVKI